MEIASMEMTPDQIRLAGIFLPYAVERQNIVQSNGIRFVHYTRADAAMNILKTKKNSLDAENILHE